MTLRPHPTVNKDHSLSLFLQAIHHNTQRTAHIHPATLIQGVHKSYIVLQQLKQGGAVV